MSEQNDGLPAENAPQAVSTASVTLGDRLRAAREARGLRIEDVAQTLKLGARQIDALERGQWDALPGVTLIRGFVRNYARHLGMDPAPMMAELDALFVQPVDNLAVPETPSTPMAMPGRRISRRDRMVLLAGLAVVILAILVYSLMPVGLSALRENTRSMLDGLAQKEAAKATEVPPPAAAEPVFPPGSTPQQVMNPQAPANEPAPPAETVPGSTPVLQSETRLATPVAEAKPAEGRPEPGAPHIRFVVDKESWVEIRDRDNKTIFSQRVPAGGEQSLSGRGPLSLVIGYAPGVRLFWHGQPVDLVSHARGDVARLVLE